MPHKHRKLKTCGFWLRLRATATTSLGFQKVGAPKSGCKCHRSHFGSRYKLGCCGHAGLFAAWFDSCCAWWWASDQTPGRQVPRRLVGKCFSKKPNLFMWPWQLASGKKLRNVKLFSCLVDKCPDASRRQVANAQTLGG